jgi:hypothetical protein
LTIAASRGIFDFGDLVFTYALLKVPFSPSETEIAWAREKKRNLTLCLLVNLKVFQYLGYFPVYNTISWLKSIGNVSDCLKNISGSKVRHFITEAKALDASGGGSLGRLD